MTSENIKVFRDIKKPIENLVLKKEEREAERKMKCVALDLQSK